MRDLPDCEVCPIEFQPKAKWNLLFCSGSGTDEARSAKEEIFSRILGEKKDPASFFRQERQKISEFLDFFFETAWRQQSAWLDRPRLSNLPATDIGSSPSSPNPYFAPPAELWSKSKFSPVLTFLPNSFQKAAWLYCVLYVNHVIIEFQDLACVIKLPKYFLSRPTRL